jgi:hypothetical protein
MIKWFGHVKRMTRTRIPRSAYNKTSKEDDLCDNLEQDGSVRYYRTTTEERARKILIKDGL